MRHDRVNFSRKRLLVEQIVVVAVLGCGMKVDAMWYVPQLTESGAHRATMLELACTAVCHMLSFSLHSCMSHAIN